MTINRLGIDFTVNVDADKNIPNTHLLIHIPTKYPFTLESPARKLHALFGTEGFIRDQIQHTTGSNSVNPPPNDGELFIFASRSTFREKAHAVPLTSMDRMLVDSAFTFLENSTNGVSDEKEDSIPINVTDFTHSSEDLSEFLKWKMNHSKVFHYWRYVVKLLGHNRLTDEIFEDRPLFFVPEISFNHLNGHHLENGNAIYTRK